MKTKLYMKNFLYIFHFKNIKFSSSHLPSHNSVYYNNRDEKFVLPIHRWNYNVRDTKIK